VEDGMLSVEVELKEVNVKVIITIAVTAEKSARNLYRLDS
jgi:hypothetical protein